MMLFEAKGANSRPSLAFKERSVSKLGLQIEWASCFGIKLG